MRRLMVGIAVMALGACSNESAEQAAPAASVEADAVETTPPVENTEAAPAGNPDAALALDGEGLRAVILASGSTRLIEFGQAEAEVMRQLETVRGQAADERGTNSDCGTGPLQYASWDDGLTAWFQDGVFVGWALNGEGGGASTMGGLGVGTTRAELDGGPTVVEVEETSLGQEFDAGGVFGILNGTGETARVTNLWGGTSCNFR
ncbi:hypothetical protein [Brevundimonas lutea]|uniref:hypothetical protein n=1 Tax=Brevundimonas lutea TaxID=2293980 RepID=UPI000F031395|nr:hypothetical protein [Brevundimonas lutea]